MTYASDLGLKVGSKIKIIAPKGTGSDYYDDQDILELTKDDRTPSPRFQNLTKGALAYFSVGDRTYECISWEHYKEPKLVWKEMTLEEVKAVQVGDKIRIDGVENEVTYTFNKVTDFGFRTTEVRKYLNTGHDTDIVGCDDVREMKYKFEHLVEETEMNNRFERTKEYDVKFTGEEIAHIYLLTGYAYGMHNLYDKVAALLGTSGGVIGVKLPLVDLPFAVGYEDAMNKLLQTPETEDQRKLRELKEQYESLGKAIDAMEKK